MGKENRQIRFVTLEKELALKDRKARLRAPSAGIVRLSVRVVASVACVLRPLAVGVRALKIFNLELFQSTRTRLFN